MRNSPFVTGGVLAGPLFQSADERKTSGFQQAVEPGELVGAFRIIRLLGQGGMGSVYLAERADGAFKQDVAIKCLNVPAMRDRFLQEREVLSQLDHPAIARLIDGGVTSGGVQYLAMEYVRGSTIDAYCREQVATLEGRIRLLIEAGDAIAYAHRRLVIHRDIKPSNLLVSDGRVKLLDFGVAKLLQEDAESSADLTRYGFAPMTPEFAAPEQFHFKPITVATDIYQFGMLIYRLLSDAPPYGSAPATPIEWGQAAVHELPIALSKHARRPPANDGSRSAWASSNQRERAARHISRDLDAIAAKTLAKDPEQRYPTMDAVCEDLRAFLQGYPVKARHPSRIYVTARYLKRHALAASAAGISILAIIAAALIAFVQADMARKEAARATASADFLEQVITNLAPGQSAYTTTTDVLRSVIQRAQERLDASTDIDPTARARLYTALAYAYNDLEAGHQAATTLARRALDLLESQNNPDLPMIGRASIALITALRFEGHDEEAIQEVDRLLARLSPADPRLARTRIRALFFRSAANRYLIRDAQALADIDAAIDAAQWLPASDRREVLASLLNSRGLILRALGHWSESTSAHRQALSHSTEVHGAKHALTYGILQLLARSLAEEGKLDEALAAAQQAVDGMESIWGKGTSNTAQALLGLGAIELMRGDSASALRHLNESLAAYEATETPRPRSIAYAKENIGRALIAAGDPQAALDACLEADRLNLESAGAEDPQRGDSLDCIAAAALAANDIDRALAAADEAVRVRVRAFGNDHPATIRSQVRLAEVQFAAGNKEAATSIALDAAPRVRKVYPASNPAFAEIDRTLARIRASSAGS